MRPEASRLWRALFVVGGILYLAGSFQHPRGPMTAMLVDPAWIPGHAMACVGLIGLTLGLWMLRRQQAHPPAMERWLRIAVVMAALEAVEMGIHTMAYVDAAALSAGQSTPVLGTHSWLATLIYPCWAITLIGLILVGQRTHALGTRWIGWLGMIGAAAHGMVMWLVFVLHVDWAGVLFPLAAIGISFWFILAGCWPARRSTSAA
ncbi:MAG: hypothetical protein ABJC19_07470 [Gemmatimonadota bacterium]